MPTSNRSLVALTIGDPASIGPQICAKALQETLDADLVLIGDRKSFQKNLDNFSTQQIAQYNEQNSVALSMIDIKALEDVITGIPNHQNAASVLASLECATKLALDKKVDAIVTGPVAKSLLATVEHDFCGQTEYIAKKAKVALPVMAMIGPKLRIALVTTHIPLATVATAITCDLIVNILKVADKDVRQRLGIQKPTWKVCGLNPHAGEDGLLGDEEITQIKPAIELAKKDGINVEGPYSADTIFLDSNIDNDTCILAMFHDQALPVIKTADFAATVNVTLGLPFIRTSVGHGTAFDIANTNDADPSSLLCAIKKAAFMVSTQKQK